VSTQPCEGLSNYFITFARLYLLDSMMKNYFFYIGIILLIQQMLLSQPTFFKTYGDTAESHYDQGNAVLRVVDGGYIVAGEYGSYRLPGTSQYFGDVYLIKVNDYGDTIWTKTFGTPDIRETAFSMVKTNDEGYILSSFIQNPLSRLWLIKINSNGDSTWSRTYSVGKGNCIRKTNDDGFIITGSRVNSESGIYLLKVNSKGDGVWLKRYNKSDEDEGVCVQQTSDNGFIIAGVTKFPERQGMDIWLIKTDSNGDTVWTKTYGGDYIDGPTSICETKGGGYFISGEYTEVGSVGLEIHIWLLRTDTNGDTIWTKKINNGSWGDYANSCKQTSDGGFIIVGKTTYDNFDSDIYLVKLDEVGNYQWFSSIGHKLPGSDFETHFSGNDIDETFDGGYIITGFREIWTDLFSKYQDLCLVKTNSEGRITEVKDTESKFLLNFELMQNYPNPFNPTTTIAFSIPQAGNVTLKIFDALGREVSTMVNGFKSAGEYNVEFNASSLASGIYLYRLQAGSFVETKKLVLMK